MFCYSAPKARNGHICNDVWGYIPAENKVACVECYLNLIHVIGQNKTWVNSIPLRKLAKRKAIDLGCYSNTFSQPFHSYIFEKCQKSKKYLKQTTSLSGKSANFHVFPVKTLIGTFRQQFPRCDALPWELVTYSLQKVKHHLLAFIKSLEWWSHSKRSLVTGCLLL